MSCLALKRNGTLCRSYACLELESGSEVRGFTCRQHQGYFENEQKVKSSWAYKSRWVEISFGYGRYCEFYPSQFYHIEESLKAGLVSINKQDLLSIQASTIPEYGSWAGYLVLVSRYTPTFHPSWHSRLWNGGVRKLWRLLQSYGTVEFKWRDIQRLICYPNTLKAWYAALEIYPYNDPEIGYKEDTFYRFFEECLVNFPEWAERFKIEPEEEVLRNRTRTQGRACSNAQRVLESDRFLEWRRNIRKSWYAEKKARCDVFKEELMAFTWHPDRFLEWCVDWEEKADILGRW